MLCILLISGTQAPHGLHLIFFSAGSPSIPHTTLILTPAPVHLGGSREHPSIRASIVTCSTATRSQEAPQLHCNTHGTHPISAPILLSLTPTASPSFCCPHPHPPQRPHTPRQRCCHPHSPPRRAAGMQRHPRSCPAPIIKEHDEDGSGSKSSMTDGSFVHTPLDFHR